MGQLELDPEMTKDETAQVSLARLRSYGALHTELSDETLAQLAEAATVRAYPAGAEIHPGDRLRLGILVAGHARVFFQTWDGRQLTVRYQDAGAFLGKVAGRDSARVRVRVEATTPCLVLDIPVEDFYSAIASRPDLARAVLAEALALLESTYATLGVNVFGTIRDRLIHALLELAERDDASGSVFVASTQQDLADDIGSTREVVSRALSELAAQALVATGKGRIDLLDPPRLAVSIAGWTDPGRWKVLA